MNDRVIEPEYIPAEDDRSADLASLVRLGSLEGGLLGSLSLGGILLLGGGWAQ
jgi:hypothetical protein